jgi:hypothetical protein
MEKQMATSITAPDATNVAYPNPNAAIKGLLGTSIEGLPADIVAQVAAMPNEELFPLGEKALHDIADDIIVLAEIRNRFGCARGVAILGYQCWRDFVEKNSRYSVRTIQRRLAEVNGKDEKKANKPKTPLTHMPVVSVYGTLMPHCWKGSYNENNGMVLVKGDEIPTCQTCSSNAAMAQRAHKSYKEMIANPAAYTTQTKPDYEPTAAPQGRKTWTEEQVFDWLKEKHRKVYAHYEANGFPQWIPLPPSIESLEADKNSCDYCFFHSSSRSCPIHGWPDKGVPSAFRQPTAEPAIVELKEGMLVRINGRVYKINSNSDRYVAFDGLNHSFKLYLDDAPVAASKRTSRKAAA